MVKKIIPPKKDFTVFTPEGLKSSDPIGRVLRPQGGGGGGSSPPALSIDVTAKGEKAPEKDKDKIGTFENIEGGKGGVTIPGKGGKPARTFFGLNTEDIANVARQQGLTLGAEGAGGLPSLREQGMVESSKEKAAEVFGEVLAGGAPVARELMPELTTPEGAINIGGDLASVEAIRVQTMLSLINPESIKNMTYADFLMHPDVVNNPLFRQLIQNELDFEVLKSGEAAAADFGTFIEGIPFVGSVARKWAGGLITTPSSQIDDITSEINTQMSYARNIREWAGMGTISPEYAREEFNRINERLRWLESKLKILMAQSAELKSAPEEIQNIQALIQQSLSVVYNGQLKAYDVSINQVEPSAEQLFQAYQEAKS